MPACRRACASRANTQVCRGRCITPLIPVRARFTARGRTLPRAGHAMGRIRRSSIPSRPYDGTPGQLGYEIQAVTGLANFHVLWDRKNKKLRLGF